MALRNTSERYEYIYGSNVRKLETDTAGKQTAKTVPAKKNLRRPEQRRTGNKAADSEAAAAIQKNAAKFLAFDWKYTLIAVIAVVLCASAAMFYLHGTVQLNVMEKQISDLKTEKATLLSKQNAIKAEIDKSINLDEIKEYAEKNLHMIYPEDSNILIYKGESNDYFRQYESVNSGK
jgi:cell division protein FtsB